MLEILIPIKFNQFLKYEKDETLQLSKSKKYYIKKYDILSEDLIKKINKQYKNVSFYLYISEKGGAQEDFSKNYARIVCDNEGGKVFPIEKITRGYRVGKDLVFFKGIDLCTVETFFRDGNYWYKITQYQIDKYTGEFSVEILYEAKIKNRNSMPRKLKRFNSALDAACEKMADYQCVQIYYSL